MQSPEPMPPPRAVLDAFGVPGEPMRLAGGYDGAWRCADLVLKRSDAPTAALEAEARVLASVPDRAFRLQRLRRAADGALAVDGWIARDHLEGRHEPGRWAEILEVADALNVALAAAGATDAAPMVTVRTDPWSAADRIAWGETPIPDGEAYSHPALRRLAAARRPVAASAQLVHGDLTGNVLFATDASPAVIDFSPYFRPPDYALGVVIADAVVWERAPLDLLRAVSGRPDGGQCLIRAILFRHVTGILLDRRLPFDDAAERYEELVEAAIALG
jgi:uncharacterized protein (TIGR02569 family)